MKKTILLVLTTITLLISQALNAQITLEHVFNFDINFSGNTYYGIKEDDFIPENCYYIYQSGNNSRTIAIYNADYSFNSENTYYYPTPPSGYKIYSVDMSRKIFNDDDEYEFLICFTKINDTSDNTSEKLILYSQDGTIIKDFGTAYSIHADNSLHIINNQRRLFVYKREENGGNYKTEVYSVPGDAPSGLTSNSIRSSALYPFPNPSSNTITLPYQLKQGKNGVMNILNVQGKLIESKHIGHIFDSIVLDVANYAKGAYIYEVNGVSRKFIVE